MKQTAARISRIEKLIDDYINLMTRNSKETGWTTDTIRDSDQKDQNIDNDGGPKPNA